LSIEETQHQQQLVQSYLQLAGRFTHPDQPAILVMHGLSGSGKSHVARHLARTLGAIQIRSDVERKRLFQRWPEDASTGPASLDMYTPQATEQTYDRLQSLATVAVQSGYKVIVDAAFLKRSQRDQFAKLAIDLKLPLVIVDCQAPTSVLRDRIERRSQDGRDPSDADLAVLEHQLQSVEPISDTEIAHRIVIDTANMDAAQAADVVRDHLRCTQP
jgi:predicted kinase